MSDWYFDRANQKYLRIIAGPHDGRIAALRFRRQPGQRTADVVLLGPHPWRQVVVDLSQVVDWYPRVGEMVVGVRGDQVYGPEVVTWVDADTGGAYTYRRPLGPGEDWWLHGSWWRPGECRPVVATGGTAAWAAP